MQRVQKLSPFLSCVEAATRCGIGTWRMNYGERGGKPGSGDDGGAGYFGVLDDGVYFSHLSSPLLTKRQNED